MYFSNLEGVESATDNTKIENSHVKCMQFEAISENLLHDSKAVCAHLMPI